MSAGVIASRYALALLKLVDETGNGETVVRQAESLLDSMSRIPELAAAEEEEMSVPLESKLNLMETALGEPVSDELRRLVTVLYRNRRIGVIRLALHSFISGYYSSRKIVRGTLTVASPAVDLESRIRELVARKEGWTLKLRTEVNPELIGGFVLELEDFRLDASVSGQLASIRKQFEDKNRRIV